MYFLVLIADIDDDKLIELGEQDADNDRAHSLCDYLIDAFMAELLGKRVQTFDMEPLPEDEMPEEAYIHTKLTIVDDYFTDDSGIGFKFPPMLKQLPREADTTYEARIKNYLLCVSADQFAKIGQFIDPSDMKQVCFFDLYNELMDQRVNKKQESKANCSIF